MRVEGEPLVIAIDIGGTKVGGAYVSAGCEPEVSGRTSFATAETGGGMGFVDAVVGLVDRLISAAPGPVRGVGVGSAGVIDPETGVVTSATDLIPGWAGAPLGPSLRAAFGLPVALTGDVLAHAIGEDRFGAGRDYGSALAVAVGTGIGGAFVTRSGVRAGPHGLAGHIGHVRHPYARDLVCSCGRIGHVEAIASGTAISEEYQRLTGRYLDGRGVDDAVDTDEDAARVVEVAGRALGEVLGGLANSWDPGAIILSGSVANSGELWWDAVRAGFAGQAMAPIAECPIVRGTLGGDAPLLGAGSLAWEAARKEAW